MVLLCSAPLRADVAVKTTLVVSDAGSLRDAVLLATRDGASQKAEYPAASGRNTITALLSTSGNWKLSVMAKGYWSETIDWSPGDRSEIALRLFKAATISGVFDSPTRGLKPRSLRGVVYLQSPTILLDRPAPGSEAACNLDGLRWSCSVPSGAPFDLRLEPVGFAPVHLSDLVLREGEVQVVEPQLLRSGGGVSGRVVDPADRPVASARVSLFPEELLKTRGMRATTLMRETKTNARGSFEFSGLEPGRFRLVVETKGLSPAIVSGIPVRAGETNGLPRPVRHSPYGEVELVLEPPLDPLGKPWQIELSEGTQLLPRQPPKSVSHAATIDGLWKADKLRADLHEVVVRDSAGSFMYKTSLDLFGGDRSTAHLAIHPTRLRGIVQLGDRPLEAELEIQNTRGAGINTRSDDNGIFETALPGTGEWLITVLYPIGQKAARVTAQTISIPPDVPPDAVYEVVVKLPGGRISGVVVDQDGKGGPAVVQALRDRKQVAQQMTDTDGKFDLVGLGTATYYLEAQGRTGTTPTPVEVLLDEGETKEVTLVTEPNVPITGMVLMPDGRPASGAVVRISLDGGASWSKRMTDIHGEFRSEIRRGATVMQVAVLTYTNPAAFFSSPVSSGPLRIQLRSDGAMLRIPGARIAYITSGGVTVPITALAFPEARFGGLFIEAGAYRICPSRSQDSSCRDIVLNPGTAQDVNLSVAE